MDHKLNNNYNELLNSIRHWNECRVPILKISEPDDNLQFRGAMRFFFQDAGQKVATKCINVGSNDTTKHIIDVLIEKFRPDMRMLSVPDYGLYEIHENGDERLLDANERPIFTQLEWNKDDREGRFLLRRMDEKTLNLAAQNEEPSLKRKLSKREKKKRQKEQEKTEAAEKKLAAKNKSNIAERLYNELPETSFTRSISNPEAVMKRRRAQKLEKRLQDITVTIGPQAGGTLRIFGETLNKDISYKSLLLSTMDTAESVVRQVVEKYGVDEDPANFCLVQLVVPFESDKSSIKESILGDNDCPLLIEKKHDKSAGVLTFHVRQKPEKLRKKKQNKIAVQQNNIHPLVVEQLNQKFQMNSISNGHNINHNNNINQVNNNINQCNNINSNNNSNRIMPTYVPPAASAEILPALIQVKENVEDIFLSKVITQLMPTDVSSFRLAPTYVLYMVSRYRASTLFHPELQAPSRAELFVPFTRKIAILIRNTIESRARDPVYLAFWLANSSDLSHFYKQDKHLSHFTFDAQEILYDSIKSSFKYLLSCKQLELDAVLHSFFHEREDNYITSNSIMPINGEDSLSDPLLRVLDETMSLMRKNRVNAALTIQIFSHLFHHINKWLFDRLMGVYDSRPGLLGTQSDFSIYCNRIWGEKFTRRLAAIGSWAEKQGLEQAAEFHLARVTQVINFLARRYSPRATHGDVKEACDKCDRLNPVQLQTLLARYKPDVHNVGAIIQDLLYTMNYAYMVNDYPLEEDFELKIPFLVPEDGYSSELVRYIPNGLMEFVSKLSKRFVQDQELCIFTVQPTSSGHWTVYFKNHQPNAPELILIQLRKKNNSMGLSIIAARGAGQSRLGIYIKNVVKNGAAAMDGRLQAGDQLLEVDCNSLIDITQEEAAELMMRTGPVVTLKIAKQAAIFHNVSDIINSVPTIVSSPQTILPPMSQQQHAQQQHHHHQPHQQQHYHHQQQPQIPLHHQPPQPSPPQHIQSQSHHQPMQVQVQPSHPQAFLPPGPVPIPPPPVPILESSSPPPGPQQQQLLQQQPHQPHQPQQPQQPQQTHGNIMQSPMKSPKKVSWVDNQPHQSLHTLIPLTHEPEQVPTIEPEGDDEDEHQVEHDDYSNHTELRINGQPQMQSQLHDEVVESSGGQDIKPTDSLTLEDIDEVLSNGTNNNWMEDSAGVIGTQEVYNDPRQKIVRERERPNQTVNIEKLSFQEKLKMFNESADK